jgi:hypothetical protein
MAGSVSVNCSVLANRFLIRRLALDQQMARSASINGQHE